MTLNPAFNGLLDLLAEAVVRALDTQTPAELTGDCNDVPSISGGWNNDKIHPQTESLQATS